MTDALFVAGKAIQAITALMYSATIEMGFVTLPRTAQRKFAHQNTSSPMIDHTPTIVSIAETGHTLPITDEVKDTLTGQDHTIDINIAETSVTTGDMHHPLGHATKADCNIHPQTDTPEGTPAGALHIVTDVTHP